MCLRRVYWDTKIGLQSGCLGLQIRRAVLFWWWMLNEEAVSTPSAVIYQFLNSPFGRDTNFTAFEESQIYYVL